MSPSAHLAKLSAKRSSRLAHAPELALLAAQSGRDARVERGGDVVGQQRVVDHVAELVQDRALRRRAGRSGARTRSRSMVTR